MLLDVLPYSPTRIKDVRPVIKKVVEDSTDVIKDSIGAVKDAVGDSVVSDSVAQAQLMLDDIGTTQGDSTLLVPMAVVTAALAGCLYLAYLYKTRLSKKSIA